MKPKKSKKDTEIILDYFVSNIPNPKKAKKKKEDFRNFFEQMSNEGREEYLRQAKLYFKLGKKGRELREKAIYASTKYERGNLNIPETRNETGKSTRMVKELMRESSLKKIKKVLTGMEYDKFMGAYAAAEAIPVNGRELKLKKDGTVSFKGKEIKKGNMPGDAYAMKVEEKTKKPLASCINCSYFEFTPLSVNMGHAFKGKCNHPRNQMIGNSPGYYIVSIFYLCEHFKYAPIKERIKKINKKLAAFDRALCGK